MTLYDLFQNFKIFEAKDDADRASLRSTDNVGEINKLRDQIDHLSLVCQATCELLDEIGISKKMMLAKIQEIDLRDGKLDGKYVKQHTCRSCHRPLAARHLMCMYCGVLVDKAELL
ncbi:hypothetical protein [Gilvimarinus japonicus]|uniref:Uncharacterized protein n=1 Tax=Gilvimarinus japonicus TaxID=1796469 RepID=A0ABV7HTT0_9GAMM